jgi:hypothetical protein
LKSDDGKYEVIFEFLSNDYLKLKVGREMAFIDGDPPSDAPEVFEFMGISRDYENVEKNQARWASMERREQEMRRILRGQKDRAKERKRVARKEQAAEKKRAAKEGWIEEWKIAEKAQRAKKSAEKKERKRVAQEKRRAKTESAERRQVAKEKKRVVKAERRERKEQEATMQRAEETKPAAGEKRKRTPSPPPRPKKNRFKMDYEGFQRDDEMDYLMGQRPTEKKRAAKRQRAEEKKPATEKKRERATSPRETWFEMNHPVGWWNQEHGMF